MKHYVVVILLLFPRLIKDFDREIKDEEGRNPPEVSKQLNDEKQSMVSTQNLSFLYTHVKILAPQILIGMQCLPYIVNLTFKIVMFSTFNSHGC